jgi:hypothetical protein
LNVWLRCGCKPNAAHIRRIVVWEKPVSAASERIDQCVAPTGVVRRPLDHASDLIVNDRSRSAGTRFVKKTLAAILQKTATPLANRVFVEAELGSHVLARQAVRASQNDAASLR